MEAVNDNMFPTFVGMNRYAGSEACLLQNVPHIRGDEPPLVINIHIRGECSPHSWG